MTAVRRAEVDRLLDAVTRWAGRDGRVTGVALCGSWAAGRATQGSDVDLVVLSAVRTDLALDGTWVRSMLGPGATLVRRRDRGPLLTEVRLRTPSGLEVEVGIADRAWAAVGPVDAGTAAVVRHGFTVLHDADGRLAALVAAVHAA